MNPYSMQNPFLNPIYGNYMQPQYSQGQIQQIQQPQIQPPIGISGRYVNDFNEIMAKDVPFSTPAVFVKNDKSEIQLREWDGNGEINPITYKRIETPPANNTDEMLNSIIQKITELEEKINKTQKPVTTKAKKEDE